MHDSDWLVALKARIKRHRSLAIALYYLTDLAYLRTRERRTFLAGLARDSRCINLGAGFRHSPTGFWAVDRQASPWVEVIADGSRLPFSDGSLDGVLCETTLEHIQDATSTVAEVRRALKVGGRAYLTVPFVWPYHGCPGDRHRWTATALIDDLAGFEILAVGLAGGPTTSLVNVFHEWLSIVLSFGWEPLYRAVYLVALPVLAPLKTLDYLLSHHPQAERIGALFYVHARKRSGG